MNRYKDPTPELTSYLASLTHGTAEYRFAHAYFKAEYQGTKQPTAAAFGLNQKDARRLRVGVERAMGLYEESK